MTALPLTISGDTNSAEALLRTADTCGPIALWEWLRTHACVELPEPLEASVIIAVSDAPPGPDSDAKVWFDTTHNFIAVRSDQGWVVNNSKQGTIQPILPDTFDDHTRLNEYLVELTQAEKESLGLTGKWGRYILPKRTGVIYN